MLAGVGKAGDYAGDPLLTVASDHIQWQGSNAIAANWAGADAVDSNAHWILYNNGAVVARITAENYTFTAATPNVVPNLAAVAVPAAAR